jgi:acid phosphatase type 7
VSERRTARVDITLLVATVVAVLLILVGGWTLMARGATDPGGIPTPSAADPVIAAAGDIACDPTANSGSPVRCDQAATAQQILSLNPTAVLALGDQQYESNTTAAYTAVFDATWGAFKDKIKPTIGNHEYLTPDATGYFAYFGAAAGDPTKAYYSYDLGAWHLVSLNSECSHIGGCGRGSPQEEWLLADLAAHPATCTLAYWHEPRWSSGEHGNARQMTTIWNDLVAAHADVVLSGHNHDYERFPALDANGAPSATGVQEFVVGTGGKNHYAFGTAPAISGELRNDTAFGILRMDLHATSYDWQFLPAPSYTFTDSGSAACR